MTAPRGLRLTVLRRADGDATRGGISATHTNLTLVGIERADGCITPLPEHSQVFEATPDSPAVVLSAVRVAGRVSAHLRPATIGQDGTITAPRLMMGGNYATGDSRFSAAVASATGTRFPSHESIHQFFDSSRPDEDVVVPGSVAIHDRDEAKVVAPVMPVPCAPKIPDAHALALRRALTAMEASEDGPSGDEVNFTWEAAAMDLATAVEALLKACDRA